MEAFLNTAGIYLAIINLTAVIITIYDKSMAVKHRWRVRESTLILISAVGGSIAMLATMLIIRHKTRRIKFMAGIPLIIVLQCVIIYFVWRAIYV